ncbi:MAG: hypothetical protein Q8L02_04565 [Candidatus Nitrotoga sp.]|nr:hypothetical protein [Candidatus Nitrotoga sp.]
MYEKLYKEFENEIGTAVSSYLLWKEIHDSTADKKILSALNRTPTSWIIIRHSLQVTFLITLHRIFETGKDVVSAEMLLATCANNISIFDKDSLKNRKDPDNKNPDWLEDYISNAYVPTVQDIHMLRGELQKQRNIFNNIYRPIRNKLIAHNMVSHLDKSNELYAKTNIDEIEKILEFLNSLKETLFELYINGKKPDTTKYKLDKRHYTDDSKRLISSITSV